MAFATASSPANREPGDNAQTATPPQAQAQPRQSPGNAEPPTSARTPSMRQSPPAHARAPSACRNPRRVPEPASACQSPQHAPEPPARTRPQRMPEPPTRARTPARQSPQRARAPSARRDEKPGSGALTEPSIGLRDVNRAEQRVPAAKNRQLCPAAVKIDDSSQPQGQNTRLFALSESPYANNRQKRPFLTSETAKNRLF